MSIAGNDTKLHDMKLLSTVITFYILVSILQIINEPVVEYGHQHADGLENSHIDERKVKEQIRGRKS